MIKATSVLLEDELRQLDDYYGMTENDELELHDLEVEILDFDAISLEDMYTGAKTVNEGENDNIMERSTEDIREVEIITKFMDDTCNCSKGPNGGPCSGIFSRQYLSRVRQQYMDMDKSTKCTAILSKLECHRRSTQLGDKYKKFSYTKPILRNKYFHADIEICQSTFLFLHAIGIKAFKNILKHFDEKGVADKVHGLKGKPIHNATPTEHLDMIVKFIKNTAEKVSIPLPGRLPQFWDFRVMKLPANLTKRRMYRNYVESCNDSNIDHVGWTTFIQCWNTYVPYITSMKPSSDLCPVCRDNNIAIIRNINMPDQTKTEKLKQAINHLEEADIQRKFYNDIRKDASVALTQAKQLEQKPGMRVFSIDYAQNIHYPSSEMQVGPAFFKTARKCGLFGINDEADNTQTNYLIDECDNIGKGANSVINLIHHHLESNICDQDIQHICADNCVGQNKNNAVVHYCAWRVARDLNKTVHLNFLLVGHTKFSPDRMFGLFKQKFSKSTVDTLHDIEECVANSTVSGKNKAICTNDYVNGIINVQWYEWNAYLSEFFTTIPGITRYHHFTIKSDDPFTVECKVLANSSAQKFNIVKKGVTLDDITGMPNLLVPPGLSLARQWYLFEEIAPLCTSKDAANLTCPKPQEAKPTSQMAKVDQPGPSAKKQTAKEDQPGPSAKKPRKVTTCGRCKEPGHTIRSCKQNKK